jgi:hypothetical protein
MTKCQYTIACPFFHRRIPIHDVMYRTYVTRYCDVDCEHCAVFMVLKATNFLKVPKDLYPNQTFRVAEILKP